MRQTRELDGSPRAKQGAPSSYQTSASLDELPIELLTCIANLLCKEDAIKLRPLGSRYAAAAAPKTFEHFHLCCYTFSLDRLRRIATSPHARHLRKITFHTLLLDYEDMSEEQFHERLNSEISSGYFHSTGVECWPPRSEWQRARKALEDYSRQCSNFFTEIAHRSLVLAIVRLPSLRALEVTSQTLRPNQYPETALRVSPETVLQMARTFNPFDRRADGHCTRLLLNALNVRAKQCGEATLRDLTLKLCLSRWVHYRRRITYPPVTRLSHEWPAEFVAAERLRALTLDFTGSRPRQGTPLARMLGLILTCQHLQDLKLKDDEGIGRPAFAWRFGITGLLHIAQKAWPLLENLDICGLDIRSAEFNSFLSHHSTSLRSLKIHDCVSDDFASTLHCIAENLALRELHILHVPEIPRGSMTGRATKIYFKRNYAEVGIDEDGIDEDDSLLG